MADSNDPQQLPLFTTAPAPTHEVAPRQGRRAPNRKLRASQLSLPLPTPPELRVVQGEGQGTGHRLGRLVALPAPGAAALALPSRDEITLALLQAGADLVAGRISVAGASAIREAAEEALRRLEASERNPHDQPDFVRAARALAELCS